MSSRSAGTAGRAGSRAVRLAVLRVVLGAVAALAVVSCAVTADEAPRAVEGLEPLRPGAAPAASGSSEGSARIYLVSTTTRRLVPVRRSVPTPATAGDLVAELLKEPSQDELDRGLVSRLPDDARLTVARRDEAGVLVIDLTSELFPRSGEPLVQALAQLVFTAMEDGTVAGVRIRLNGRVQPWPDGEFRTLDRPLVTFDYPDLNPADFSEPALPVAPGPAPENPAPGPAPENPAPGPAPENPAPGPAPENPAPGDPATGAVNPAPAPGAVTG